MINIKMKSKTKTILEYLVSEKRTPQENRDL